MQSETGRFWQKGSYCKAQAQQFSGENKRTIGRPKVKESINSFINELMNWLIKRRRFWAVICGKEIAHYINRTEHPSGISPKIRPAAHFVWLKIWPAVYVFHKKSGLRRMYFIKNLLLDHSGMHLIWKFLFCLPIYWWWKWFRRGIEEKRFCWHNLNHSVDRDSGEQTTWIKQSLFHRYVCVGCQLNSD